MNLRKAAIDPLWQCLCPSWSAATLFTAPRYLNHPTARSCLRVRSAIARRNVHLPTEHYEPDAFHPFGDEPQPFQPGARRTVRYGNIKAAATPHTFTAPTNILYGQLHSFATEGETEKCRALAEFLIHERKEKPNAQLYNALILSNTNAEVGAAWRVADLLEEMQKEGFAPDTSTCHAVLKVLAVHVDHLLRADVLMYMQQRWIPLSEEGSHDVAAGLLREGLFEQALEKLEEMRTSMSVDGWLWDMAVYMLCDAGEIEEAYRIMRPRYDGGQLLSRTLWTYLLDKASDHRHYAATTLVWNSQVNHGYINPSSGVCLNVLATVARAGDTMVATEVFTHLSKRGTAFKPIHYELLIQTYLSTDPPDLDRALSILTIMPMEKLEPTVSDTRPLFQYLSTRPHLLPSALTTLRSLHEQSRRIPLASLNLLIECHVHNNDLTAAMNLYKLLHTFAPTPGSKSPANIETFNLLLKGCRDDSQGAVHASFLVQELLALRIRPIPLTYDRLIIVFVMASKNSSDRSADLLDWAYRHLADMLPLEWFPRFGTVELLALALAEQHDERCWEVLQAAEENFEKVAHQAKHLVRLRGRVEESWQKAAEKRSNEMMESMGASRRVGEPKGDELVVASGG